MKIKLFGLLIIPSMLLLSCAPSNSSSENPSPSIPPVSSESDDFGDMFGSSSDDMPWEGDKVTVYFFESAVKTDIKNPVLKYEVNLGSKLTKPETDPVSSDPAFNTFKGWSSKPIVLSDDDYWDFENDSIPGYIADLTFRLYGQWDYVEQ